MDPPGPRHRHHRRHHQPPSVHRLRDLRGGPARHRPRPARPHCGREPRRQRPDDGDSRSGDRHRCPCSPATLGRPTGGGAMNFDAVVVGAGPAGSAAALVLAQAGKRVALIERGPFPGSKNMYGGVVYGRVLDTIIPEWWTEIPAQRWVTRRATMVLSEARSLTIDYRTDKWGKPPYNGCTTYRPDFDDWLANKAEAAGAVLVCSTTVTGLLRDRRGAVHGVRTDRPGGDIEAPVVIACDGVNSLLAKEAGLYQHRNSDHFTLGVKEVLALP